MKYVNNNNNLIHKNPNLRAKLILSGQDRFRDKTDSLSDNYNSLFFDSLQILEHHTHTPNNFINVYNFGLHPESEQPSGSLNFSRVENPSLNLTFRDNSTDHKPKPRYVNIYALNYNQLKVVSGVAGVAWNS